LLHSTETLRENPSTHAIYRGHSLTAPWEALHTCPVGRRAQAPGESMSRSSCSAFSRSAAAATISPFALDDGKPDALGVEREEGLLDAARVVHTTPLAASMHTPFPGVGGRGAQPRERKMTS
jgi:hypothetical protein